MSKKSYKHRVTFTFDGHRYEVYGQTLEEVYTKKANKLRDLEEGKVLMTGSQTVSQWIDTCLEIYKPNANDETKEGMRLRANKYIISSIGGMRLKDVTAIHCQKIMSACIGMSKSHITKLSQELKFYFEKARKNKLILDNPAADLAIPRGEEGERRSITDEERKHLLLVAEEFTQFNVFLLMLFCGCRPAEAYRCQGKDIAETDGVPMLHIRGTKTAQSDRFVPIPDYLYPRIKTDDPDAFLAVTETGRKFNKESYHRTTVRLRREMNISMGCKVYRNQLIEPFPLAEDFVPYDLRHTYCTDLCRKGVDVRIAQKLMGHASIEITANIYTHVDQSDLVNVARLLNGPTDDHISPTHSPTSESPK